MVRMVMAFIFFCSSVMVAEACRSSRAETATFLSVLDEKTENQAILAEVRIRKTEKTDRFRLSEVEVIQPIKGVAEGQKLEVVSDIHSCAKDAKVQPEETYYIAGKKDHVGYFRGSWSLD